MDFQRWWGERWEAAAFKGIDLSQSLVSRVNFSTLPLNHHLALPLSPVWVPHCLAASLVH